MTWNSADNTPLSEEEKAKQAEQKNNNKPNWLKDIIKNSTDEEGNYLWHCTRCQLKAPIYKKDKKDGSGYYFQCSSEGCKELFYESETKPGTPDTSKKKAKKGATKPKPKGY